MKHFCALVCSRDNLLLIKVSVLRLFTNCSGKYEKELANLYHTEHLSLDIKLLPQTENVKHYGRYKTS